MISLPKEYTSRNAIFEYMQKNGVVSKGVHFQERALCIIDLKNKTKTRKHGETGTNQVFTLTPGLLFLYLYSNIIYRTYNCSSNIKSIAHSVDKLPNYALFYEDIHK